LSQTYLVTGATGFIGRHLVARLLERGGRVHAIARDSGAPALGSLRSPPGSRGELLPLAGDLTRPCAGLADHRVDELAGSVDHVFHVAALYDLAASAEALYAVNVEGTRHMLELAERIGARTFHHVSSIAVAGRHDGLFTEEMLEEGQELDHPYHRSKFEAERLVRASMGGAWRVYRPGIVVGHSRTGVTDKADGPYQLFKAIQKIRGVLPQWFPLVAPELGDTNLVPVDYVADAVDHLAHRDGLDGRTFHLVAPRPQRIGDVVNTFAGAAHAPRLALRVDSSVTGRLPVDLLGRVTRLPTIAAIRRQLFADLGIPEDVLPHIALKSTFDARDTLRELEGTGIEPPPLDAYAWRLWDYWERHLDPDLFRDASFEAAIRGRTAVITGASSGIGRAAAKRIAAAGGIAILVARSTEKLETTRREIEEAGGIAHVHPCDLSDLDAIDALVERILAEHGPVEVLVNNAGRSIRRSTALSYDRFHDYERTIRLNYLGAVKLTMGLLPEMRRHRRGHIVNVSSIGVQFNPPRFSAYVASKAALDAWTRVVSSETIGDRVTFTTVHMPLVRTPMIAPTQIYDAFPTISPEEAADLVCEAIRTRPKQINTRLGTFAEVAYALAPKAVDQLLHLAYRLFPDSAAARGEPGGDERASGEAVALAHVMRGVHW
jgi:NAD(P)-dependent dehydrogenase (short-subunit alcohol dehydrogenase family)